MEDVMSDAELISAIQMASKQEVNAALLPSAAAGVLSKSFSGRLNERTMRANGLGYEVRLVDGSSRNDDGSGGGDDPNRNDDGSGGGDDPNRNDDGSGGGDDPNRNDDGYVGDDDPDRPTSYVYFDMNGRQLGQRSDDGSGGGDDGRRYNDGSGGGDDPNRNDDGSGGSGNGGGRG